MPKKQNNAGNSRFSKSGNEGQAPTFCNGIALVARFRYAVVKSNKTGQTQKREV